MTNWKIHFIYKCDNCGSCWEVRVPHGITTITEDDFRTYECDECQYPTVGLTEEEGNIWWAIVDAEETEGAEWREW